jgi:hypothetical protein
MQRGKACQPWIVVFSALAVMFCLAQAAFSVPEGSFELYGSATRTASRTPLTDEDRFGVTLNEYDVPESGMTFSPLTTSNSNSIMLALQVPGSTRPNQTVTFTATGNIRFLVFGPPGSAGQQAQVVLVAQAEAETSVGWVNQGTAVSTNAEATIGDISAEAQVQVTGPQELAVSDVAPVGFKVLCAR